LFAAALLAGTSLGALAVPAAAFADQLAQSGAQHDFSIPPQPLADALTSFSQQSGLQVSVDSALVAGLNSNGATGTMSVDAALAMLLAGTNLTGTYASATTIIIEPLPGTAPSGATQLGPITVLGSRQPDVPLSNVP